ncbi:hypothetical protein ASC73_15275 [Phenylobacterium sp. Root1277]|nr:hypothetical protein ASC73_15275 [Phenylobacterium sp. Root1277]
MLSMLITRPVPGSTLMDRSGATACSDDPAEAFFLPVVADDSAAKDGCSSIGDTVTSMPFPRSSVGYAPGARQSPRFIAHG